MYLLVAVQVAFCFVVQFVAGLFVASLDRLAHQPLGFSAERILNLETTTYRPQPPVYWEQVAEHLRTAPGVEAVALTTWPLMSGESRVSRISLHGGPPFALLSDILNVSPGWFDAMRVPLLDGRDLRTADTTPTVALVNQAFAKQYFDGANPVGKSVEIAGAPVEIVGFVRDARSRDDVRLPIRPIAYLPYPQSRRGTFVVRTASANPLALAGMLRAEVPRARPEFRVSNIRAQVEIDAVRTARDRLLALLGVFFAAVALLLAALGVYGVLNYSVELRRREIAIRVALGAPAASIARQVTARIFTMAAVGAAAGVVIGLAAMRYLASLLFGVGADWSRLAQPAAAILAASALAALPAIVRALRIDPAGALKTDY